MLKRGVHNRAFLGKLESTRWAVPLPTLVSAEVWRHDRPLYAKDDGPGDIYAHPQPPPEALAFGPAFPSPGFTRSAIRLCPSTNSCSLGDEWDFKRCGGCYRLVGSPRNQLYRTKAGRAARPLLFGSDTLPSSPLEGFFARRGSVAAATSPQAANSE
jgi:hypothetical protein